MARPTEASEQLKALANRRRQEILALMLERPPVSPSEVASEMEAVVSNISYHFRVLADCKAINLRRTTPVRGSLKHFYSADPEFVALPWVAPLLAEIRSKAD